MGMMTFVVEYEDGMEPPVYSDMDVAGGKLKRASWTDALGELEGEIQKNQELTEKIDSMEYELIEAYERFDD